MHESDVITHSPGNSARVLFSGAPGSAWQSRAVYTDSSICSRDSRNVFPRAALNRVCQHSSTGRDRGGTSLHRGAITPVFVNQSTKMPEDGHTQMHDYGSAASTPEGLTDVRHPHVRKHCTRTSQ